MAFAAAPSHHHPYHDAAESYVVDGTASARQHLEHMHHYQDPANAAYYAANTLPTPMSCDIKPRLTKDQHDILESHFQKQQKPPTTIKKNFAEQLNVSLDKVNNWFQNRRAKSKQDAKKQAGAYNLYPQQQGNFSSDSDASPSFTSTDYFSMMQHCSSDDHLPNGVDSMSQFQEQSHANGLTYSSSTSTPDEHFLPNGIHLHNVALEKFEGPQDVNRRTLTQEQFDSFAQHGGMMEASGQFSTLQQGFSNDASVLHQVFPDMAHGEFKQQDAFAFPHPSSAPLPSNDSSVSSSLSDQSAFPSSTAPQDHSTLSSTSSDWSDSRSSSVSLNQSHDNRSFQQQNTTVSGSRWQPGQSIPVDPNDLQRQFNEAQQRAIQQHQRHQQQRDHFEDEQPLAWPTDEAYMRRDSQNGTMLAQQMSEFALQTPQPQQTSTFRVPAPPQANAGESIAARRQRPRPAALGLASLRSQSHGGTVQPSSPGQGPQILTAPGQPLRRIRSSNVVPGVAQGRVMKTTPGSAQRSPMHWTFADAMNSPNMVRHVSTPSLNSLAPPTPLSPRQGSGQDHQRPQFPPWQSSSHLGQQQSISETDAEHDAGPIPVQQPNVSSPPHTPMFFQNYQQQTVQTRVCSTVVNENTPPQSAPAVQTSFPANAFMPPPPHPIQQQGPPQSMPGHHHPPQAFVPAQPQPQQFMHVPMQEQQFQFPSTYGPPQHFQLASDAQPQLALHFASGVPVVNAQGQLTLAYPPQMQQLQFVQHAPPQMRSTVAAPVQYSFVTTAGTTPGMHITSQIPKPASQPTSELFVHEYSPPSDVKRSLTPRKAAVELGPKNYTFANQGPEHFEKDKAKKDAKSSASSSPGSASS